MSALAGVVEGESWKDPQGPMTPRQGERNSPPPPPGRRLSANLWPSVSAVFGRFGPEVGLENVTWGPSKLLKRRIEPKEFKKLT